MQRRPRRGTEARALRLVRRARFDVCPEVVRAIALPETFQVVIDADISEVKSDEGSALRDLIGDLGSKDFEVRAAARTAVVSAGNRAVPELIREIEAEKARSVRLARSVAALVFGIALAGSAIAAFFRSTEMVAGSNIAACLVLFMACALFRRPVWFDEASKLLAKFGSPEVTRALLLSLTDVWGEEQPRIRAAIVASLQQVRPQDATWLTGETLDRLIAMLRTHDWSSPTCVQDVLVVARALVTVGATEAIPELKRLNYSSLMGERRERVRHAIDEAVRQLEALKRGQESAPALLRPVPAAEALLLKPSSPQQGVESEHLLRPSDSPH